MVEPLVIAHVAMKIKKNLEIFGIQTKILSLHR